MRFAKFNKMKCALNNNIRLALNNKKNVECQSDNKVVNIQGV